MNLTHAGRHDGHGRGEIHERVPAGAAAATVIDGFPIGVLVELGAGGDLG